MLQVKDNKIVQNNIDYQIKGVSLIDIGELGLGSQSRINTAKCFWNINTIRVPVYPPEVIGRRSPFPYRPNNGIIERAIVPCIAYADAMNLNVIIDWHQINPLNSKTTDQALIFWKEVIPKIKDFDNVIFEIYNEPSNGNGSPIWESTATESWAECKPFLQTIVSGIRELSENLIICPTPTYCRLPLGANNDPIEGENVAYSVHVYPPEMLDMGQVMSNYFQGHVDFNYAVLDQIRQSTEIALVMTEVGFNMENEKFTDGFRKLLQEIPLNWIAWCLDPAWWPPLLTKYNVPSKFGKEVKKLMA